MILTNKNNKILANKGQIIKVFTTEAEFNAWSAALSPQEQEFFSVVKKYETGLVHKELVTCLIKGKTYGIKRGTDYFTIRSDTDFTVAPKWTQTGTMEYSIDNGATWVAITNTRTTPTAKKLLFRGKFASNSLFTAASAANKWTITGGSNIKISGDITTLLNLVGDLEFLGEYAFADMFYNNPNLVSVSSLKLPPNVSKHCYYFMFHSCPSLRDAPTLPAKALAEGCYHSMFYGCALTVAPKLPATLLANYCYHSMFRYCASLVEAPELPVTSVNMASYQRMFLGCASLVTAPNLPATSVRISSYEEMFYECTALTKGPDELPAKTLADNCYKGMFTSCKELLNPPKMAPTTVAVQCCINMFINCHKLTEAPELPATTLKDLCYQGMFSHCRSLIKAPKLPATTLANSCYADMFADCTSLVEAPALPATTLSQSCYSGMLRECTNLRTPMRDLPATSLPTSAYNIMFSQCPALQYAPRLPSTNATLSSTTARAMFEGTSVFAKAQTSEFSHAIANTSGTIISNFSSFGNFNIGEMLFAKVLP